MTLPRYKSHKTVQAAKIIGVRELRADEGFHAPGDGSQMMELEGIRQPIHVSAAYIGKHRPAVGGYYVQYEDGYQSFSPADVFEAGYRLIEADAPATPEKGQEGLDPNEKAAGVGGKVKKANPRAKK